MAADHVEPAAEAAVQVQEIALVEPQALPDLAGFSRGGGAGYRQQFLGHVDPVHLVSGTCQPDRLRALAAASIQDRDPAARRGRRKVLGQLAGHQFLANRVPKLAQPLTPPRHAGSEDEIIIKYRHNSDNSVSLLVRSAQVRSYCRVIPCARGMRPAGRPDARRPEPR